MVSVVPVVPVVFVGVVGVSPPQPTRESDMRESNAMPKKNLFNLCSLIVVEYEPRFVRGNRYKSNMRGAESPGEASCIGK